jgi:hypothetical protein
MTIKDLKAALNTLPDNTKILLASDDEGNNVFDLDKELAVTPDGTQLVIYPKQTKFYEYDEDLDLYN